jgi:taurine dioxygenase
LRSSAEYFFNNRPRVGYIVCARARPPAGGDTMFANMCAAYDGLSAGMKKTLEGMRAVHAKAKALDPSKLAPERRVKQDEMKTISKENRDRMAVHPVCPRHPETGRRILFVNPTYTVKFEGWTVEESEPLLDYLYKQGSRPENTCRFQWDVNSIAFWDNRTSWHYALNDYQGHRRLMHRVSVDGTGFAA